jgi:membrane-associated phospholipid phosphatase
MSSERFAKYISILGIPPTFATAVFTTLVLQGETGSLMHRLVIWLVAVLFSGVLQMGYVLMLRRRGQVGAYDVPNRLQRTQPYLVSVGVSLVGLLLLLSLHASVPVWALMWCYCINTLLTVVINLRWKISAHMMGMTGPLVFLYPLLAVYVFLFLPFAVLLGWSRVTLKAHTLAQVVAGAGAGIVLTLLQITILIKLGYPLQY